MGRRSLFVIARNSTFTYKGRAVDAKRVSRELGVRYVLEGSVRKARDRVRITVQLIDATAGNHFWSNRYDGGSEDIFDLQDRITESVVGAIQPSILLAEIERTKANSRKVLTRMTTSCGHCRMFGRSTQLQIQSH
jgi:adenylate cyclase